MLIWGSSGNSACAPFHSNIFIWLFFFVRPDAYVKFPSVWVGLGDPKSQIVWLIRSKRRFTGNSTENSLESSCAHEPKKKNYPDVCGSPLTCSRSPGLDCSERRQTQAPHSHSIEDPLIAHFPRLMKSSHSFICVLTFEFFFEAVDLFSGNTILTLRHWRPP